MMSHLTGRAKAWGTAEWARNSATCASSRQFSNALKLVFDPGATDRERARELSDIKQGGESVCDYAIHFRTMATESGWNTAALYDVFLKGLSDQIQDLMVPLDLPPELDSLIALAIRTDNRLQERRRKRASRWTPSVLGSPTARWNIEPQRTPPEPRFQRPLEGDEEPMQMGGTRLSREERERRYREGRCFYCGERGHLANVCYGRGNQRVPFRWSADADAAFRELKRRFTTAPILTLPDPARQFVVEVDASSEGIGAILSQRAEGDHKLHPCAFLSRRLTPAERNYDVGDRELLAVKAALEEWRHWLEGAQHPFLVWTDHKNLQYIRKAKRLNSRQARWSLFFNRFDFSLSYRPGSRNTKPDALSRLFSPESVARAPEPILPLNCVVGAVIWPIESKVIHWAHSSLLTCHPGVRRTMFAITQRFWWPAMEPEVREYVEACSVCATNKNSSRTREGLL
uniref:Gypsy retrotransposon integrase-like protein 1 n=1 Tax=Gasterosteus aculeatus aculeatus TaxID=481459 RepID=A0AAQ4R0Q4_GASAC